jgi:hypothetical protein
MLGKVIRYEFKSTARLFLLMYAALIVMAAINMIVMPWDGGTASANYGLETAKSVVTGITLMLYITLAIATAVVTLVIIVVRFYRLLGDQGYLWFTLPVTTNQHILAKLIAAVVWCVASFLAIVISILVLFARLHYFAELKEFWIQITSTGLNVGAWIVMILIALLISTISSVLLFYVSVAIGPHITKSRLGGSVIAYIIAYIATQIIGTIAIFVGYGFIGGLGYNQLASFDKADPSAMADAVLGSGVIHYMNQIGWITFGIVIVTTVLYAVVSYIITHRMLTKKLNLA